MIKIEKLNPFGRMCISLGMLPSSYKESLTYEEQLLWFFKYLDETVIPTVNNNAEAVEELQALYIQIKSYVDDYFKNLDVQEEINNKLDDMAESGQLTDIIAQYLGLAGMFTFDSVADMKLAENLTNGSKCSTLGYYSVNDGGNAVYKIRTITNDDVVDDKFIVSLYDNTLIAELIYDDINVKKIGAYGDGTHDDTSTIQAAINKISETETLIIPSGTYKITPTNTYSIVDYGTGLTPYYGLLINNKQNINIECEGILYCDFSTHNMNTLAITNSSNIKISGLRGVADTNNAETFIQYKNLIHVNKSSKVYVTNASSVNTGGCCLFVTCDDCTVENSLGERTDIANKSGALFGSYDSTNIKIDKCECYGATNDGDISVFGGGNNNITVTNCSLYASYRADKETIVGTGFQGICVDSGVKNCTVTNNYTYGYYYGIDVKTSTQNTIVSANQCVKNKIGIAVRLGEGNSASLTTSVCDNIINPNGGNGNTTLIGNTGEYTMGIYAQNNYGINIDNNIVANTVISSANQNFIGMYLIYTGTTNEAYRNNTNITNNYVYGSVAAGSYVVTSSAPAIYIEGSDSVKFNNINILGNTFKYRNATGLEFYDIFCNYVENVNISENVFSVHSASKGFINITNSNNVKISNNKFNKSGYAVNLNTCNFIDISNNYLINGGGYYPLVVLTSCTYIGFKGNYYKKEVGSEGVIVQCESCNYVTAINNLCYTSRGSILSNYNTTSTNLVEDNNSMWAG